MKIPYSILTNLFLQIILNHLQHINSQIIFKKHSNNLNIKQLAWCGENEEILFILSNENYLYRLTNNDSNLDNLNEKLHNLGIKKLIDEENTDTVLTNYNNYK